MKSSPKIILRFIERFILYATIGTITLMIYDKIIHQIPFASYNIVDDLFRIVVVSFTISTSQLIKK